MSAPKKFRFTYLGGQPPFSTVYTATLNEAGTIYQIDWEGGEEGTTYPVSAVESHIADGAWQVLEEPKATSIEFTYVDEAHGGTAEVANEFWKVTWTMPTGAKSIAYYSVAQVREYIACGLWIVRSVNVGDDGQTAALVSVGATEGSETALEALAREVRTLDTHESILTVLKGFEARLRQEFMEEAAAALGALAK